MAEGKYNLKIIDENRIPLSSGVKDYTGAAFVTVIVCIVIALLIMYFIWFKNHKKRIVELSVMGINGGKIDLEGMKDVSIFHPIRTIRFETELENQVVAGTANSI